APPAEAEGRAHVAAGDLGRVGNSRLPERERTPLRSGVRQVDAVGRGLINAEPLLAQATEAVDTTLRCLSALPRKRTNSGEWRHVRFVPIATERSAAKALYSITSSARASRGGGTSRPRALAVGKLMTSSNLVGCITGRSAGFSPLRMRPA